jgi:Ca2+-binding RTX toxin-like protein
MATLRGNNKNNILKDLSPDAESYLYGNAGDDRVYGLDFTDYLFGGDGNDKLYGGTGNDWLFGEKGADKLYGGAGNDGASYYYTTGVTVSLDNSLKATGDAIGDTFFSIETLAGSNTGADTLAGNASDNKIYGNGGNDRLYGRAGNDQLFGENGKDSLFGGTGDDWLIGGRGADKLKGGEGRDGSFYGYSSGVTASLDGSLVATGEAYGDTFISIENLEGSNTGADILSGDSGANRLWGNGGNDALYGRDGDDYLQGDAGNDYLYGENGKDELWGGVGADVLNGGADQDYAIYFDSEAITVSLDGSLAATGNSVGDIFISIENLAGSETGNDTLAGDANNNELWGDGGDDTLYGRAGDDKLFGNAGNDRLSGEAGNDMFVFKFKTDGIDVITDFETGDKIEIRTEDFGVSPLGTIAQTLFQSAANHTAATSETRFLFDTTGSSLWFDSDGNGAAEALQLATFANAYQLAYTDIVIGQLP